MKLAFPVATPDTADANMLALRGPVERSFATLARLGYEGTELMLRDPGLLHASQLANAARDQGLTIGAVSTGQLRKEDGLSLCDPDDAKRRAAVERMKAVLDLSGELGAQVNIGTVRGPLGSLDAARRSFDELLEHSRTPMAMEPQTRWVINWLNTIGETLEFIGDRTISILFDLYHARLEERSVYASLIQAKTRVSWVQFSDTNRRAPGWGGGDFNDPLRVLEALGYDGFVSVECLPLPSAEAAAEQGVRWLRPLLTPT
jgi:5-keto-L-gluconate epimerase